ncbi:phospholipase effector Tle1 domain-containing protein [Bradyrhizobium arachidis]|uniref:phospholipase effector Tle1 domain-containing protein n=1 Tax=Bradyrhizobium arachidis TaxID=858423 RepID=UPI0038CF59CF
MDGTTNDATCDIFSNVYAINQLVAESKRHRDEAQKTQVTFYLPGVGTKFTVKRVVNKKSWFGRTDTVRQQIFGDDIEQLILRAYVNLTQRTLVHLLAAPLPIL